MQTVWPQIRPDKTVGPDLDTNCLTLKEFFEKVDLEKNQQTTKKDEKLPSRQRVLTPEKPLVGGLSRFARIGLSLFGRINYELIC